MKRSDLSNASFTPFTLSELAATIYEVKDTFADTVDWHFKCERINMTVQLLTDNMSDEKRAQLWMLRRPEDRLPDVYMMFASLYLVLRKPEQARRYTRLAASLQHRMAQFHVLSWSKSRSLKSLARLGIGVATEKILVMSRFARWKRAARKSAMTKRIVRAWKQRTGNNRKVSMVDARMIKKRLLKEAGFHALLDVVPSRFFGDETLGN
jgi:hypothetical protein